MKYDPDELVNGAIPSKVRDGRPPRKQTSPSSSTARTGMPAWMLNGLSVLSLLGGLLFLFLLWRAAAFLIRAAAGTSL